MSEADTLTAEEAATELGVTPSRIRQMIRGGLLEARRFGKVHVIPRTALRAAEQRKTAPGPAPKATAGATAKDPAETTAKLNKAFREAKEAEESSQKKTAKKGKAK